MIDQTNTSSTSASMPAGFCQQCGKPLDQFTIRKVGNAVYCEPCLAAKLGTGPAAGSPPTGAPNANAGYGPVHFGATFRSGPGPVGFTTEDLSRPGPNPGRAFLLGLIPGVGAMYNEQYDKGLVHLAIFVVLESLARVVHPFDIFVAGWIFYMAIEAHHTARARRDGTPLPNPFGLNDIGTRLGFDRWGHPGAHTQPTPPAAAAHSQAAAPPSSASWGAPADVYPNNIYSQAQAQAQPATPLAAEPVGYAPPQVPPYGAPPYAAPGQHTYSPWGTPPVPPTPPYAPPYAAAVPPYTQASSYTVPPVPLTPRPARFPVGALWLIGFGMLFLLANTHAFAWVNAYALVGFGLMGLAVWSFLRCYLNVPAHLQPASEALPRLVRALRSSIWIALTGVLIVLDGFHILGWGRSWPLFIIVSGVMALLSRAAASSRSRQMPMQPVAEPVAPAADPTPRASHNGDWNHTPGTTPADSQGGR